MTTTLGILLATLLTLAIFSRVVYPHAVFRWVSHLLLGAGAGYVAAIILRQVLLPAFSFRELQNPLHLAIVLVSVLMIGLMALRFATHEAVRVWGLLPLGTTAGVGGALALAGMMRGSLLPQLMAVEKLQFVASVPALDLLSIVLATLTSLGVLLYLLPSPDEARLLDEEQSFGRWLLSGWQLLGYWALMLALGALVGSTVGARLTLLIERVQFLLELWF
jgi:hypothetical protein